MNTIDTFFIITVWVNVTLMGRSKPIVSHQIIKVSVDAMVEYVNSLDQKYFAEVKQTSLATIFEEYSELVRNARTAGLIKNGNIKVDNNTYSVPEGVTAAAASYAHLSSVCKSLMSSCKARPHRAELESIHDRARRLAGFMTDLSN